MKFNMFVIPFLAGTLYLVITLSVIYGKWIKSLTSQEKKSCFTVLFSSKIMSLLKEIVEECLFHKHIFKTNIVLGYMHTSLAFGWFMLILVGHYEATHAMNTAFVLPYYGIFFRYFEFNSITMFTQVMDFVLLVILSGVVLAWVKRLRSKWFGLQKTTQHTWGDKLALSSLWFIFPFRFLAESMTSGLHHNGGFLTAEFDNLLIYIGLTSNVELILWWAYSLSLTLFFIAMPFSRYMHILTEPLLILFRHAGIEYKGVESARAQAELNACSRCGICIDSCQMSSVLQINTIQPAYFLRSVRYKIDCNEQISNCLLCGRCSNVCPVGIDSLAHRLSHRQTHTKDNQSFSYLPQSINKQNVDLLYFAGCMGHLTPSVTRAMSKLLDASGLNWSFMDKEGSICCGRPQLLAGEVDKANQLKDSNSRLIRESGASTLVTSCPICYKMFKEKYNLTINVLHHTQWLSQAVSQKMIQLSPLNLAVSYHDPCELGRGSIEYHAPRSLLSSFATLLSSDNEKEKALCCGGSLANTKLSFEQQQQIASSTLRSLSIQNPDVVATACPLCKKTFSQLHGNVDVMDVAELALNALEANRIQNEESWHYSEEKQNEVSIL